MKSKENRPYSRALLVTIAAVALGPSIVSACEVCYGAADSPWLDASRSAVFLLLGITVTLLAAFATFFFYLRNRMKAAEAADLLVDVEGEA